MPCLVEFFTSTFDRTINNLLDSREVTFLELKRRIIIYNINIIPHKQGLDFADALDEKEG